MIFRAAASRGGWIGIGLLAALLAVEVGLVTTVLNGPIGPLAAVLGLCALALLALAARLSYWTWGYFRLRYEVTRDGVLVHWAASRQVIPMAAIAKVRSGRPYAGAFHGVHWPGYAVGHSKMVLDDGQEVDALVSATAPPSGQVLLVGSGSVAYALSPADPALFVEEIRIRRRLGTVQSLDEETVRPRPLALPIWGDRAVLRLLLAAGVVNALLFAWIAWRFPLLPASLPLRFEFDAVQGLVAGPARPPSAAWSLPLLGLAALGLNGAFALVAHDRARLGAGLLAGGALIMQILIAAALFRVL